MQTSGRITFQPATRIAEGSLEVLATQCRRPRSRVEEANNNKTNQSARLRRDASNSGNGSRGSRPYDPVDRNVIQQRQEPNIETLPTLSEAPNLSKLTLRNHGNPLLKYVNHLKHRHIEGKPHKAAICHLTGNLGEKLYA